jgi:NTE family protein
MSSERNELLAPTLSRLRLPCIAFLAAATLSAFPAAGQMPFSQRAPTEETGAKSASVPSSSATRPKIGLALSGGGARGGAHIGVLRALRELRVPIDYIAGTSMGAVIGGLYASGLDEDQLQQLSTEANWDDLFNDVPSRDDRTFHRKRDDDLFLVKQGAGLKNGRIGLPMGLMQGQDIDLFLTRVMLPVGHVVNFYDLPIPFTAVAVDMVTGEAVILERGSLAQAIRASLSIPAAVAPIEIDGRLLGDGGVVQNLPIDTVRRMGADVVIAVDISTPLATRDELTSLVSITGQLVGFLTRRGTAEQIERLTANDVLIRPELGDIGSVSFERIEETYPAGYAATMAVVNQLLPLALSPDSYVAHRAARPNPRLDTPPRIDLVRLENNSNVADNIVEARLESIPTGVPFDLDATQRAIARVHGLELFQHVGYALVEEAAGTALEITVDERAWGPDYLQFGLQYSAAGSDESLFGLSLSYLRTAMNSLGAEWRSTIALGDEPELSTVWHQPLGRNALTFVTAGLALESPLVNVYDGSERIARVRSDEANVEFALGRELDNWGELRFGFLRGMGEPELDTGDPAAVPLADFDRAEIYARFTIDTLDSLYFPKGGNLLVAEWRSSEEHLGASTEFEQFSGRLMTAHTFGRHTVAFGLRYDTTIDGVAPPWNQFEIGGFWDLSGFAQNELSGQNAGHLIGAYYRQIGKFDRLPIYAGITLEKGNAWQTRGERSFDNSLNAGSLWIGADTPVGPMYLSYGRAEGDRDSIYFVIGNVLK